MFPTKSDMETYLENVVKRITELEKTQKESLADIENGIRTTVQNPEDLQSKMRRNLTCCPVRSIPIVSLASRLVGTSRISGAKFLVLEINNFLDDAFSETMEKFEPLEKVDRLEQEEDSEKRLEELYGKITQD
ncbi:unnamed protein product [Caenorhabditis nigoni]